MSTGLVVAGAAVVLALVGGLFLGWRDGRFRGTHAVRHSAPPAGDDPVVADPAGQDPSVLRGTAWASELGERATLLQFSSAFCAPCRATRRVLAEAAALVPGVAHIEIDAEHHLDLVRRLGIARTPTTLVLDAAGREVSRASGAPARGQVLAVLEQAVVPEGRG